MKKEKIAGGEARGREKIAAGEAGEKAERRRSGPKFSIPKNTVV
jgi:hypothetical protein